MNNIMIPTSEDFVMKIAKAISNDRLFRGTDTMVKYTVGLEISEIPNLEIKLQEEFEMLWDGNHPIDVEVRSRARLDAIAAINAINLQLLITPTQ